MTLSKMYDTKNNNGFLVEHQMETYCEFDHENPPRKSENGPPKDFQPILNQINAFLMSLVIS